MRIDEGQNKPTPESVRETTYLVYVDDSGDETQDLLTAVAIPVTSWTALLEGWKKYRRWVAKKFEIPTSTELHALDLGTNSKNVRGGLPAMRPGNRNKIATAGFQTLAASQARVLTMYAPVPEGSGKLYSELVDFVHEFCLFHDSHAVMYYDGTAESLRKITTSVHRNLDYNRRVLEDPRGYSSSESHLIQMADFVAYSAHQAMLNQLGTGKADTFLREKAYSRLLEATIVWPGGFDKDGQPGFQHPLGIRTSAQKHDELP